VPCGCQSPGLLPWLASTRPAIGSCDGSLRSRSSYTRDMGRVQHHVRGGRAARAFVPANLLLTWQVHLAVSQAALPLGVRQRVAFPPISSLRSAPKPSLRSSSSIVSRVWVSMSHGSPNSKLLINMHFELCFKSIRPTPLPFCSFLSMKPQLQQPRPGVNTCCSHHRLTLCGGTHGDHVCCTLRLALIRCHQSWQWLCVWRRSLCRQPPGALERLHVLDETVAPESQSASCPCN
jgi:hypothetical protein